MAANTFRNATAYASRAIGVLAREIVLTRAVTRDFDVNFGGASGATVNARIGALLSASDFGDVNAEHDGGGGTVTRSAVSERYVAVTLDKMPYSAVPITTEDQSLQVDDFAARVLLPQSRAVAERIEGYVATALGAATYETGYEIDLSTAEPWDSIVDARALLNEANCPRGDRFLVVGSEAESVILKDPDLKKVDSSGTEDAFREAIIGRLAGFTVLGSNALEADEAYALHKSAFILATRAPVGPIGGAVSASAEYGGVAATWAADWNGVQLQNESIVWSLAGTAPVYDGSSGTKMIRAVKLTVGS